MILAHFVQDSFIYVRILVPVHWRSPCLIHLLVSILQLVCRAMCNSCHDLCYFHALYTTFIKQRSFPSFFSLLVYACVQIDYSVSAVGFQKNTIFGDTTTLHNQTGAFQLAQYMILFRIPKLPPLARENLRSRPK